MQAIGDVRRRDRRGTHRVSRHVDVHLPTHRSGRIHPAQVLPRPGRRRRDGAPLQLQPRPGFAHRRDVRREPVVHPRGLRRQRHLAHVSERRPAGVVHDRRVRGGRHTVQVQHRIEQEKSNPDDAAASIRLRTGTVRQPGSSLHRDESEGCRRLQGGRGVADTSSIAAFATTAAGPAAEPAIPAAEPIAAPSSAARARRVRTRWLGH